MRETLRTLSLSALCALGLLGCASPPDTNACQSVVPIPCVGGMIDATGAWVSAPWTGPLANYPAYTTFRVCHGLGRAPTSVEVWGSFSPTGNLAQLIGNPATIVPTCDGDPGISSNSILVRNGGGQDFYARFVLR